MMIRDRMVKILFLVSLLGVLPLTSVAEETRRDGNWWREQDRLTRSGYVAGFIDGMDLGNNFSYWKFAKDDQMNTCMAKVLDSYAEHRTKYFQKVTNAQLVDGLDSLYADPLNRRVLVADGVWLTVNVLAGTPLEKIESMLKAWRHKGHN